MLYKYYINREWMVSPIAQSIYRTAARLSIGLFCLLIVLGIVREVPSGLLPLIKVFVLLGVIGAATTTVAMEYFLFGFDTSPALKKVFWFCVMALPLLGPGLYCLMVYSRSDVLKAPQPETAKRTPA
jgi:hypothetical protein